MGIYAIDLSKETHLVPDLYPHPPLASLTNALRLEGTLTFCDVSINESEYRAGPIAGHANQTDNIACRESSMSCCLRVGAAKPPNDHVHQGLVIPMKPEWQE